MVSEKKRTQQLKQPDEFQKKTYRLISWLSANKMTVMGILVPALLLAAGAFSWNYIQKMHGEERRERLAKIDLLHNQQKESAEKEMGQRSSRLASLKRELEKLRQDLNSDKPSEGAAGKLEELEKREQALRDEIAAHEPDLTEAFDKYLTMYREFKDKPEGWRAGLSAAQIQISKKDYLKASELLKDILSHSKPIPFYQFQVRMMYMELLAEQEKFQEALAEKEALLRYAEGANLPQALLLTGRLELLSGNKEQAIATFDKILNEHNTSQEAGKARAIRSLWR